MTRSKSRATWRWLAALVAILLVLTLAPAAAADDRESLDALQREQRGIALTVAAEQAGALGVYFDGSQGEYVAVFSRGDPGSTVDLDRFDLPVRIEVLDTTKAEISEVSDRLNGLVGSLPTGTEFAYWFDPAAGITQVEGSAPSDVFDATVAAFPGRLAYSQEATGGRLSRDADPPPHRGGATLLAAGHICTSGFTVRKTSDAKNYLVTAGHCYGLSTPVIGPDGASFGTVTHRLPFPTFDLEMLGGSTYKGQIYTGNATGNMRNVTNASDPLVNSTYCSSGTASLEHCNHTVTSLSATYCDETSCTANLFRFTNGNLLIEGDSGGPFYFKSQVLTISVRGILIAKIGTNGYAHKWSTIRDLFGVTIVLN